MELVNLKDASEQVTFAESVKKGLGKNQGLFFPKQLPKFDDIESTLINNLSNFIKLGSHLIKFDQHLINFDQILIKRYE